MIYPYTITTRSHFIDAEKALYLLVYLYANSPSVHLSELSLSYVRIGWGRRVDRMNYYYYYYYYYYYLFVCLFVVVVY